jgi:hypothetical protein
MTTPKGLLWLPRLLRYVRWTEREFVDILAGVSPAPAEDRAQLHENARRRAEPERHVRDAVDAGELVVHRGPAAGSPAEQFYVPWRVDPTIAIRWFLMRRKLFPDCPLTEEHLVEIERASPNPALRVDGILNSDSEPVHSSTKRQAFDPTTLKLRAEGFSARDLADRLSTDARPVDQRTVQRHLAGKMRPHPDLQRRYAELLNSPIRNLFPQTPSKRR